MQKAEQMKNPVDAFRDELRAFAKTCAAIADALKEPEPMKGPVYCLSCGMIAFETSALGYYCGRCIEKAWKKFHDKELPPWMEKLDLSLPAVRNPKGEFWMSTNGVDLHLLDFDKCIRHECVYARFSEVFRPGAVVQKKYENGSIYRGVIGKPFLLTNDIKIPVFCGTQTAPPGVYRNLHPKDLTLITPAPAAEKA